MIKRLNEEYPKQMMEFFDWFEEFKILPEWKEYYGEFYSENTYEDIELDDVPMFIKFALFKKFLYNYNIEIDTDEYFHDENKSLYSTTLKHKETYINETDYLFEDEAMEDVIKSALELIKD